jgi:hypothetical protein
MTVQIQEQHRATQRILALVKLITELVVRSATLFSGVNISRAAATYSSVRSLTMLYRLIKVTVDIREDITRKVGIQKYRPGAHKGLDQALALRQMLFNIVKQGVFPPAHFRKARFFFMLPN